MSGALTTQQPPRRWAEVERILDSVLDHDPVTWPRLVGAVCGGDRVLRITVESLLRRWDRIVGFMERPVVLELPHLLDLARAGAPSLAGRRVGPYRLVREIGRGGMGFVWLAERCDGRTGRVAVKLIDPCVADSVVMRRFLTEQWVLASLAHPNIARLVGRGETDDGRVCLILEHVEGQPIDRHCEERRLCVRGRVTLFVTVIRAIEHAHARRIVHRDLKPSNILVTGTGVVKVVDFGIAKLLGGCGPADTGGTRTRTGERWMTPSHAAPEQICGEPVTTRTDVYQLGVVLYELLTGCRPLETDRAALAHAASGREPTKPSRRVLRKAAETGGPSNVSADAARWARLLRGDLDAIVLRAMRNAPGERYDSAAALADDLACYLEGGPVAARRRPLPRFLAWCGRLLRITSARPAVRSARGTESGTAGSNAPWDR